MLNILQSQVKTRREQDELSYWQLTKVLWRLLKKQRVPFLVGSILFSISYVLVYAQINLFGLAVDSLSRYASSSSLNEFWLYIAALTGAQLFIQLARAISNNILVKVRTEAAYDVKAQALSKLTSFPLVWHQRENSGNKIEKIQSGVRNMQQFMGSLSKEILPIFLDFAIVISIFAVFDWRYLLFFLVYASLFALIQFRFASLFDVTEKAIAKLSERVAGNLFESANNILTTKSNASSNRITERVLESERLILKENHKARNLEMYKSYFITALNVAGSVGIFTLIAYSFVSGNITIGFVLVYNRYYNELRNAITRFGNNLDIWRNQKTNIARMMPIFDEQPETYFGNKNFPKNWQSIKLVGIGFEYPQSSGEDTGIEKLKDSKPKITDAKYNIAGLESIDLEIRRGEKIGLVGRSGSGKSTLAKILIGLYKINRGSIKIGSKDFYALDHTQITDNLSIVLQDTELFNMSLRENITLLRQVDEQLVQQALEIAQLTEVVAKLPQGLDTKVGEKGYKLSGGERQRVGIARAVCSQAGVLIFDEATSALDSETEQNIQEAIDGLPNKTIISIAHRLSTLKNTDRIVVFEKGKIVEQGNFNHLRHNSDSKFGQLWKLQATGVAL